MRAFVVFILLSGVQTAQALPSATIEQCTIWEDKITEYTNKLSAKDSRELKTHYRTKIEEYQKRLAAGRCQESRLAKVKD